MAKHFNEKYVPLYFTDILYFLIYGCMPFCVGLHIKHEDLGHELSKLRKALNIWRFIYWSSNLLICRLRSKPQPTCLRSWHRSSEPLTCKECTGWNPKHFNICTGVEIRNKSWKEQPRKNPLFMALSVSCQNCTFSGKSFQYQCHEHPN